LDFFLFSFFFNLFYLFIYLGNQKVGSRFKLEKLSDFGFIRMVFHFLVCEELIPEPSTDSDLALNPLFGYWLLEKISISIRV